MNGRYLERFLQKVKTLGHFSQLLLTMHQVYKGLKLVDGYLTRWWLLDSMTEEVPSQLPSPNHLFE